MYIFLLRVSNFHSFHKYTFTIFNHCYCVPFPQWSRVIYSLKTNKQKTTLSILLETSRGKIYTFYLIMMKIMQPTLTFLTLADPVDQFPGIIISSSFSLCPLSTIIFITILLFI